MARKKHGASGGHDSSRQQPPALRIIAIDNLRFDPRNPRIVERLGARATQRQIYDLLLDEQARELVPSFIANGYFPYEPLIVRPEQAGRHTVLEGNRRLAALMAMRDSEDEEERAVYTTRHLDRVPCLVFRGDERAELAYLGLRHISKTKDWSPSAKAAFVERLLRAGASVGDASQQINTTAHALRQLLLTRRLFEKAQSLGFEIPAYTAEGDILFWHLGDAVRRQRTRAYLRLSENEDPLQPPEVDDRRLENLLAWVYGNPKTGQTKLITSIRDIPPLDLCLGNDASTNALEAGASIPDALEAGEAAGAKVSANLDRAKSSVQRATGGLTDIEGEAIDGIKRSRSALEKAVEAFDREFAAAQAASGEE